MNIEMIGAWIILVCAVILGVMAAVIAGYVGSIVICCLHKRLKKERHCDSQ